MRHENLVITFVDKLEDFYVEKSGQSSCERAKWSWLAGIAGEIIHCGLRYNTIY